MYDLIENIGFGILLFGFGGTIFLIFASTWKIYYGKMKLSSRSFYKFSFLIGITAIISGLGFAVSITANSLPEFSIFRTFLASICCIGIYPAGIVGAYIFDMKYYGYVESAPHKKKK